MPPKAIMPEELTRQGYPFFAEMKNGMLPIFAKEICACAGFQIYVAYQNSRMEEDSSVLAAEEI